MKADIASIVRLLAQQPRALQKHARLFVTMQKRILGQRPVRLLVTMQKRVLGQRPAVSTHCTMLNTQTSATAETTNLFFVVFYSHERESPL